MSIKSTFQNAFEGAKFHVFNISEEGKNWHVVARDKYNHSDRYVFEVDSRGVFWLTQGDSYVRLAESEEELVDRLAEINGKGIITFLQENGHLTESENRKIDKVRRLVREHILKETTQEEFVKKFTSKFNDMNAWKGKGDRQLVISPRGYSGNKELSHTQKIRVKNFAKQFDVTVDTSGKETTVNFVNESKLINGVRLLVRRELKNGLKEGVVLRERFEIDKSDYVNSHGKDPKGHGLWFFEFGLQRKDDPSKTTYETVQETGNFASALKAAKRKVEKETGFKAVYCGVKP